MQTRGFAAVMYSIPTSGQKRRWKGYGYVAYWRETEKDDRARPVFSPASWNQFFTILIKFPCFVSLRLFYLSSLWFQVSFVFFPREREREREREPQKILETFTVNNATCFWDFTLFWPNFRYTHFVVSPSNEYFQVFSFLPFFFHFLFYVFRGEIK